MNSTTQRRSAQHSALRASDIRLVTWDEWIMLPIREQVQAVRTVRSPIRLPTVIVLANFAKVTKKRPKFCARTIRERDGNRCRYTGVSLRPDEGSADHVLPRSRGGKNAWEIRNALMKEERLWKERSNEVLAIIPLNLDGYLFDPKWEDWKKQHLTALFALNFVGWEKDHALLDRELEKAIRALRTDDAGREKPPTPRL